MEASLAFQFIAKLFPLGHIKSEVVLSCWNLAVQ